MCLLEYFTCKEGITLEVKRNLSCQNVFQSFGDSDEVIVLTFTNEHCGLLVHPEHFLLGDLRDVRVCLIIPRILLRQYLEAVLPVLTFHKRTKHNHMPTFPENGVKKVHQRLHVLLRQIFVGIMWMINTTKGVERKTV